MFTNNENRARLADAIDKNIVHTVRANARETPPIRGDAPITLNPHGAPAVPSRMADTMTSAALGPLTPGGMPRQTPPGGKISPDVARALPRQVDGIERRVNEFLQRKA
jgi:hypothetical protein